MGFICNPCHKSLRSLVVNQNLIFSLCQMLNLLFDKDPSGQKLGAVHIVQRSQRRKEKRCFSSNSK